MNLKYEDIMKSLRENNPPKKCKVCVWEYVRIDLPTPEYPDGCTVYNKCKNCNYIRHGEKH